MDNQNNPYSLLLNTFQDIPTPHGAAQQLVALVKDNGKVTGYKLSDGTILTLAEGVQLARQGGIRGVGIASNQGTEYLKSLPDNNESNNLGNLPSIVQDEPFY